MATTHYSELKVFALSTKGVENACCEFDVETLRPTYHLLIGIPGKSNAFAISSKLGLPDYIIESAKSHLSEQDESFEDLLADLETSRRTIEKEQAEIASYKREIEKLKHSLDAKQEKLTEQKERIIKEANEKANAILREAKEVADETMKQVPKIRKRKYLCSRYGTRTGTFTKKNGKDTIRHDIGKEKTKETAQTKRFQIRRVRESSQHESDRNGKLPPRRQRKSFCTDGNPSFASEHFGFRDHRGTDDHHSQTDADVPPPAR